MWGNILTEVSYMQNFNMGFSNNKADVLIHLTQWQYWWWFWFSFLWVLYYLLVARVFRYRTLKFNPRIASTLRPHGKWGDLLSCLIPVTWCLNILLNSNFILKLIEWQSESSLFTLRVRAKQWYWIYKLDLRNISDIFSTPRNIGRNKWQFSTFGDLQTADDYLHIMQMRAYNNWSKDFWTDLGKKATRKNDFSVNVTVDSYSNEYKNNAVLTFYKNLIDTNNLTFYKSLKTTNMYEKHISKDIIYMNSLNVVSFFFKKNKNFFFNSDKNIFVGKSAIFENFNIDTHLHEQNTFKKMQEFKTTSKTPDMRKLEKQNVRLLKNSYDFSLMKFLREEIINANNDNNVKHPDLDDENRILKKNFGKNTAIRLLKQPKVDTFFKDGVGDIELLRFRFNEKLSTTANKPIKNTVYLTFKQKRYNQRVNIPKKTQNIFSNNQLDGNSRLKYSGNPFLKKLNIIEENFGTPTRQYRMVKKAKSHLDTTRVGNWNRLLRSRRVLVLPAHINITVITNSFDIVHSWHIPGLGLKMDCLPGRATHHTLYIDNVGLYYGQCAEICGRYHHHMPIRICALPFEHFLVWWHTFGLPKFLFPSSKVKTSINANKYFNRKFAW